MKVLRLTKIPVFALAVLTVVLFISSCDKEKEPIKPPEVVKASATVNDSYNTYTNSAYSVTQDADNHLVNTVTFSRTNNSRIRLVFPGTEEGTFSSLTDTSVVCQYVDASERVYQSDTGKIVISTFVSRDGSFTISGGFEFNASYPNIADPTHPLRVVVKNGGFVNITNN